MVLLKKKAKKDPKTKIVGQKMIFFGNSAVIMSRTWPVGQISKEGQISVALSALLFGLFGKPFADPPFGRTIDVMAVKHVLRYYITGVLCMMGPYYCYVIVKLLQKVVLNMNFCKIDPEI